MSAGHDEITEKPVDADSPAEESAAEKAEPVQDAGEQSPGRTASAEDELTGQLDLDEKLAKPVFDGSTGIEAAQVWIGAFLIAVVALIVYSNAIGIPLHYPDRAVIANNPGAQSVPMAPIGAKTTGVALVPMITVALNGWLAPASTAPYHAVNILLHALNGILVYLLVRRLLRLNQRPPSEQAGFELSEPVAMVGGLLMALHPLATESVNLVIGRAPLMCATFSLLAIVLALRAADREEGYAVGALIGAGASFALAWACDISALFVPAIILMADWIANGRAVAKRIPTHAALWGIGIAFVVWWMTVSNLEKDPYDVFDPDTIVAPPVKSAAYSLGMALGINPVGLSIDHDLPPAGGFLDPELSGTNPFVTASTAIGLGLVALLLIASRSASGLGLLWFLVALLPSAYFIPPYTQFSERSLYFGLCGVAVLVPWAVSKIVAKKAFRVVGGLATVGILLAAAAGTFTRNNVWQSEESLWEDAALKAPSSPGPFVRLGSMRYEAAQRAYAESEMLARENQRPAALSKREEAQREFGSAMSMLEQAAEMKPDDAGLRGTLGSIYQMLNQRDKAIASLTEAMRLNPSSQEIAAGLAMLYAANPADADGRQRALDYFQRAERLGPLPPGVAANYAELLLRMGNAFGAAQAIAPLAAGGDPQSPATAMLEQMKPLVEKARDAEVAARELEQKDPGAPEAAKRRIDAMLANGELLPAFYKLDRYLQLHPDDAEAWLTMGTTRARSGEPNTFIKEYGVAPQANAGDAPIWMQLVRRCAELGRWMAARAYIEHAATQSAEYSKPLVRLGELAVELKQPAIASAILEDAIKADAADPAPWLALCDIAIASENLPQARKYLDEAERLGADPGAVAPRREKAGATPEEEKQKPRTILR